MQGCTHLFAYTVSTHTITVAIPLLCFLKERKKHFFHLRALRLRSNWHEGDTWCTWPTWTERHTGSPWTKGRTRWGYRIIRPTWTKRPEGKSCPSEREREKERCVACECVYLSVCPCECVICVYVCSSVPPCSCINGTEYLCKLL